jgi:pheromone a factor receptor
LKGGQSGLTLNRFLRLSALATIDLLISLPLALYYLIPFSRNLVPWTSFNDIHFDFSTVNSYDANFITRHPQIAAQLLLSRWLAPITAIVFFSFFGLGEDALRDYLALYARLKKMVMGGSRSFPHTQARYASTALPCLRSYILT